MCPILSSTFGPLREDEERRSTLGVRRQQQRCPGIGQFPNIFHCRVRQFFSTDGSFKYSVGKVLQTRKCVWKWQPGTPTKPNIRCTANYISRIPHGDFKRIAQVKYRPQIRSSYGIGSGHSVLYTIPSSKSWSNIFAVLCRYPPKK